MNIPEKPQFHTELVWLTKERAAAWLRDVNSNNRARSEAEVRRWVDRFNLGRYQPTHQGMAFDEDGIMVDGQTRCEGLVRSDLPGIWIQVTTNIPRSTFDVIDVGRARAAGHLIPAPFSNEKAAAARWLLEYPRLSYPANKVDTEIILDAYDAHRESIDKAIEMTRECYRSTGISHSLHGALLSLVISSEGQPASLIPEWVNGVTTGAGLDVGDPRLALRNRWAVDQAFIRSGAIGTRAGMFLLVRAWNAYATGEKLTKLQLPKGSKANNNNLPEVTR